jgi:methionyl-tRNA formyltransferase
VRVDRLIRACTPGPGAWTSFRGQRLKLGPVRVVDGTVLQPGELRVTKHSVRVGTATGPLQLGDVQVPGKRPVPAPDWARGARPGPGERLG